MKALGLTIVGLILLTVPGATMQADKRPNDRPAQKSSPRAPLDHLKAARTSLDEIEPGSLTDAAAEKVKDIKARLGALEDSYVSHGRKTMTTQKTASGGTRVRIARQGTWSAQVPDIDQLLGDLLQQRTPLTREDDRSNDVRRRLTAVRSHLTAFAKGASGTSGPAR
jgi:hypothetical protein